MFCRINLSVDRHGFAQQMAYHIRGGVGIAAKFEKLRYVRNLIAIGQQRQFRFAPGVDLAEADVGNEAVA